MQLKQMLGGALPQMEQTKPVSQPPLDIFGGGSSQRAANLSRTPQEEA